MSLLAFTEWAVIGMPLNKRHLWCSIAGESITIKRPHISYDAHMDEVIEYGESAESAESGEYSDGYEHLDNVLFGTPSADDIANAERLHGMRAAYTLAIPQSYTESLRDCIIVRDYDDTEWKVIIDKPPLPIQLTPTAWNREVVVGVEYG